MDKKKWFLNGGRGSGKSFRLLCETYENKIAELEKENAELKEKNKWYSEQVCNKECAEVWGQLTKAKELLKRWVELSKPKLEGYPIPPIQEQTEQFLKDCEVEK